MKKLFTAIVAILLIASLAISALAGSMYVNTDQASVYQKNSKSSKIISHLPHGDRVDVLKSKGGWSHINYINRNGVKKSGWISSKNLSSTVPCKHKWGKWKVTKKATCSKEGSRERVCSVCGKKSTEKLAKLEHKWGKWSVTKKATCTSAGEKTRKCSVCGKKETKAIGKTGHSYGDWTVEQAATCAEPGIRTRVCSVCGHKDTASIDPLPHTFEDSTILVPLTREADGERAYTCTVCGKEVREAVKAEPALNRSDRGDDVKAVQSMLNALGYNAGSADGIYGPKLDAAFGSFARDNGLAFAEGWLKPVQLDALASRWLAARPAADGSEGAGAPVSLLLTVDPVGNAGGVRTFNWILTNEGPEACTVKALLMGTGADHDFSDDDMAVALENLSLKPGTANSLGDSFTVPTDLGEDVDAVSFAAIVESDKTGERWISNVAVCTLGE